MDLNSRFSSLQQCYQADPYPSARQRQKLLDQLTLLLKENQAAITQAISDDFGYRAPYETDFAEIYPSLKSISHAKKSLSSWMAPERKAVSIWFRPAKASVMYQPLGVVGVIVPWNYPLFLALGPLIGALAAGNRVMVKMSEFTPNFSQLFAELCQKYLPAGWVDVVTGGIEIGEAFSKLPFDHLLFTGSGTIGKKVMQAASQNLTPVTLELGGKSPVVFDKDFPIKVATEKLLFGKLLNSGQTCLAPDYLLIHKSKIDDFVQQAKAIAPTLYPEWQTQGFTGLASQKQIDRYKEILVDAKEKGATLVPLWELSNEHNSNRHSSNQSLPIESCFHKNKAVPLLVFNTTAEMRIRQEEIFGPMLPVIPYEEHSEARQWINSQPRPLALYLFSYNRAVQKDYMLKTISGGVTLNDTILHVSQEELPFGGVGASGMGHYHGEEGFKTFSKAKSIYHQSRFAGTKLMYPPQSKLAKVLLGLMKR